MASSVLNQLVSNPINWALGGIVLYLAFAITSGDRRRAALPPPKHPDVVERRNFNPKELAKYDGRASKAIYLAVKGVVFDVSSGASFYGPDGMYGNFAGRDASRGLAKDSFDAEMVQPLDLPIDDLKDLTPSEVEALNGWFQFFSGKYTNVGQLVNE
ncbi:cytochrome b5-like heme/steroid binding domain-containing protein [Chytriomyces sp. MP71]|nr:cytochrome b5-like heme/steroid binding domain-containing protein [Chytriomyces sp. MP71]